VAIDAVAIEVQPPSQPMTAPDAPLPVTASSSDFDEAFWPLFMLAFRAAFRILRHTAGAEDVAAEVLGRLHARWSRLGTVSYREAWVVRAATNAALDVVRRATPPITKPAASGFEDHATSRLLLAAAMRALPRRQRESLALHYLVGLPVVEVAEVLGVSPGSVRQHIGRGLQRLRVDLRPESTEEVAR